MNKLYSFILIFAVCFGAIGCTAANTEEKYNNPEMTISEFVALTDIQDGRPNIYLITKVVNSEYWQVVVEGAKDAGKDLGCNVYYAGTSNDTYWEGQIELLDEAVANGADAIILAPNDSTEMVPKIEEIHNMGIPVVLVDTVINSEEFDICYMTENYLAGQQAAEEMIRQLKNAGHNEDDTVEVGILVGSASTQTITERLSGFFQYWSENASESWTINKKIMNCNGDVASGEEIVGNFLTKNKDIAGLYATNNTPTRAVSKVVYDSGYKNIVVVGFDYSDEIKSLIGDSGYIASTILQRQYEMSYRGVQSAIDIINGKDIVGKFVDTGVTIVNSESMQDSSVAEMLKQY